MKVLIVTIALLAVLAMAKPHPLAGAFTDWMHEFGKSYSSEEFQTRFRIWVENKRFVENFKGSHKVAMNRFGDLTAEEFAKVYLGTKSTLASKPRQETTVSSNVANPASVDWRTKGAVTGVKNQGQCGSCWSFSTTGSTEGAHAIKTGSLVSLSEQNLVDCSTSYGNQGCNGGLMDNAFQYIIANNGIDTEACYPYTAQDGTCAFKQSCVGATLTSYKDVTSGSESALETAVATVGPISVAIDAGTNAFQFYSGGVFYDSTCGNGPNDLDHGVLVVGYDQTSNGQQYWIVKNSWGTDWGLNGYIWMSKNRDNNCGIATMPSYPIA